LITASDAGLIRSAASYQASFPAGSAFRFAADINCDGIIDALDVNLVKAVIHQAGNIDQTALWR
jgi:hypothetical protein